MTDITRLINSIKRRTSSARELGYDVLFVALDDLDVLADSLETALRANAAQAAHIEQLQDKFNKLAAENVALKRVPETDSVAMLMALDSFRSESLPDVGLQKAFENLMYHRKTPTTVRIVAGIKADGVDEFVEKCREKAKQAISSDIRENWWLAGEHADDFAKQLREGGKV
ncbi:hypothetical protein ACGV8V_004961 [Klebsiella pneumoniae]